MILALNNFKRLGCSELITEHERTLIAGCVKGEKATWDLFVRQYSGLIYHTIKKALSLHHTEPRPALADDLFREVFLSLVKDDFFQLRRFHGDNGCTLASWLRMIAARRTVDQLRKAEPPTQPLEENSDNHANDASVLFSDNETNQILSRAVENLRPRDRVLIDLFFRQELAAEDVARILGISIGTVYTQKNRVIARLRHIRKGTDSL